MDQASKMEAAERAMEACGMNMDEVFQYMLQKKMRTEMHSAPPMAAAASAGTLSAMNSFVPPPWAGGAGASGPQGAMFGQMSQPMGGKFGCGSSGTAGAGFPNPMAGMMGWGGYNGMNNNAWAAGAGGNNHNGAGNGNNPWGNMMNSHSNFAAVGNTNNSGVSTNHFGLSNMMQQGSQSFDGSLTNKGMNSGKNKASKQGKDHSTGTMMNSNMKGAGNGKGKKGKKAGSGQTGKGGQTPNFASMNAEAMLTMGTGMTGCAAGGPATAPVAETAEEAMVRAHNMAATREERQIRKDKKGAKKGRKGDGKGDGKSNVGKGGSTNANANGNAAAGAGATSKKRKNNSDSSDSDGGLSDGDGEEGLAKPAYSGDTAVDFMINFANNIEDILGCKRVPKAIGRNKRPAAPTVGGSNAAATARAGDSASATAFAPPEKKQKQEESNSSSTKPTVVDSKITETTTALEPLVLAGETAALSSLGSASTDVNAAPDQVRLTEGAHLNMIPHEEDIFKSQAHLDNTPATSTPTTPALGLALNIPDGTPAAPSSCGSDRSRKPMEDFNELVSTADLQIETEKTADAVAAAKEIGNGAVAEVSTAPKEEEEEASASALEQKGEEEHAEKSDDSSMEAVEGAEDPDLLVPEAVDLCQEFVRTGRCTKESCTLRHERPKRVVFEDSSDEEEADVAVAAAEKDPMADAGAESVCEPKAQEETRMETEEPAERAETKAPELEQAEAEERCADNVLVADDHHPQKDAEAKTSLNNPFKSPVAVAEVEPFEDEPRHPGLMSHVAAALKKHAAAAAAKKAREGAPAATGITASLIRSARSGSSKSIIDQPMVLRAVGENPNSTGATAKPDDATAKDEPTRQELAAVVVDQSSAAASAAGASAVTNTGGPPSNAKFGAAVRRALPKRCPVRIDLSAQLLLAAKEELERKEKEKEERAQAARKEKKKRKIAAGPAHPPAASGPAQKPAATTTNCTPSPPAAAGLSQAHHMQPHNQPAGKMNDFAGATKGGVWSKDADWGKGGMGKDFPHGGLDIKGKAMMKGTFNPMKGGNPSMPSMPFNSQAGGMKGNFGYNAYGKDSGKGMGKGAPAPAVQTATGQDPHTGRFYCRYCDYDCGWNEAKFKQHCKEKHVQCIECGESLPEYAMEAHMLTHVSEEADQDEELKSWIAARKAKWPSKKRIEAKANGTVDDSALPVSKFEEALRDKLEPRKRGSNRPQDEDKTVPLCLQYEYFYRQTDSASAAGEAQPKAECLGVQPDVEMTDAAAAKDSDEAPAGEESKPAEEGVAAEPAQDPANPTAANPAATGAGKKKKKKKKKAAGDQDNDPQNEDPNDQNKVDENEDDKKFFFGRNVCHAMIHKKKCRRGDECSFSHDPKLVQEERAKWRSIWKQDKEFEKIHEERKHIRNRKFENFFARIVAEKARAKPDSAVGKTMRYFSSLRKQAQNETENGNGGGTTGDHEKEDDGARSSSSASSSATVVPGSCSHLIQDVTATVGPPNRYRNENSVLSAASICLKTKNFLEEQVDELLQQQMALQQSGEGDSAAEAAVKSKELEEARRVLEFFRSGKRVEHADECGNRDLMDIFNHDDHEEEEDSWSD
eukprot:g13166.t1